MKEIRLQITISADQHILFDKLQVPMNLYQVLAIANYSDESFTIPKHWTDLGPCKSQMETIQGHRVCCICGLSSSRGIRGEIFLFKISEV